MRLIMYIFPIKPFGFGQIIFVLICFNSYKSVRFWELPDFKCEGYSQNICLFNEYFRPKHQNYLR